MLPVVQSVLNGVRTLFGGRVVSPSNPRPELASLRRENAILRGAYSAAQNTEEQRTAWQLADNLSPKSANNFQVRRLLRSRSRHECQENCYALGIVNTMANDLIGTGPRLQSLTNDETLDRAVEAGFAQWMIATNAAEKLHTLTLAKKKDGEGLALVITNPKLDSPVKLDFGLFEAEQCTTPNPVFNNQLWVDGVVLDDRGNIESYNILDQHPGDFYFANLNPLSYKTYPASQVIHFFRKDRPGQVRGVPELTPALDLFNQLRRFTQATLRSAETAALFSAVIQTNAPADSDDGDDIQPMETIRLEQGMATTLPQGYQIGQVRSEHPQTTYPMFKGELLREIARCLNVPWNVASGDSSGYNYSSSRLDHILYGRSIRVERSLAERVVVTKLFLLWLAEAVLIPGYLPPGVRAYLSNYPHRWFWDPVESIDPTKDASADISKLEANLSTLEEICAERGLVWTDVLTQRAKEKEFAKSLGLIEDVEKPGEKDQQAVKAIRAGADDQPRDEQGRFATDGGGESLKVTLSEKLGGLLKRTLGVKERTAQPTKEQLVNKMEQKTFEHHMRGARDSLEKAGVPEGHFKHDVQKTPEARQMAISKPAEFDKHLNQAEHHLTNATHFQEGAPTEAVGKILQQKVQEVRALRKDVQEFRERHKPEDNLITLDDSAVLPDHFGRKGAAEINIAHALDHLASGGHVHSAVEHVKAKGGVSESTAKRYVRAAVKRASEDVRHEIKMRSSRRSMAAAAGDDPEMKALRKLRDKLQLMLIETRGWCKVEQEIIDQFVRAEL